MKNRGKEATRFKPGQSGNPAGRPKKSATLREMRDLARGEGLDAMRRIIEISKLPIVDAQMAAVVLKAAQSIVAETNKHLIADVDPSKAITTVEQLIAQAIGGLQAQLNTAQTPAQFAALLKSAIAILNEERKLNEELKDISDAELTKQIEAGAE